MGVTFFRSTEYDRMMRFIDVRGDEKITYRVVRIFYSDKTSLVWLADNLRATKYADGTDIEANNFKKDTCIARRR